MFWNISIKVVFYFYQKGKREMQSINTPRFLWEITEPISSSLIYRRNLRHRPCRLQLRNLPCWVLTFCHFPCRHCRKKWRPSPHQSFWYPRLPSCQEILVILATWSVDQRPEIELEETEKPVNDADISCKTSGRSSPHRTVPSKWLHSKCFVWKKILVKIFHLFFVIKL